MARPPSKPLDVVPTPSFLTDINAKDHYMRKLEQLRSERTMHDADWRDITDSIMPTRGRYLLRSGEKSRRATSIINSKATLAQRTCTAGLKAGIASPARPWFKLTLVDTDLMKYSPVRIWLSQVQSIMYSVFAGSNFYNSMTIEFSDLANFGNGAMIMDEDNEDIIRCTTFAPGEYFFGLSARNAVNTLYREYTATTLQVIEQFGINSISQEVRNSYDSGNYLNTHVLVHAVEPNIFMDPSLRGWRRMPISSCYFEKNRDDGVFLERKGYEEWSVSTPRWDVMAGDIYGSGPGMVALGDARALQKLERRKAQGIDKIFVPPLQGPPHLRISTVNNTPGGVTYVDPNGSGAGRPIQPVYEIPPQGILQVREEIREHERRIDQAYYVDLFLMISQSDRREITAREIDERHEEKLFALGPMLERNHDENLNVMIGRAYRILSRKGMIPPPPDEMRGHSLKPEYVSILAYAQKAASINAIERGIGFVGQLAGAKPYIIDIINPERTTREYLDVIGFPQLAISTDAEYDKIKQERANQDAAANAATQGQQAVESAKLMSETDTSRKSALTDILKIAGS